jgi:alcohol dehydrogenase class IV
MVTSMNYDLLFPRRVLFGWGRRVESGEASRQLGRRAFCIGGSRTLEANGTIAALLGHLEAHGCEVVRIASASREPEVEDVDAAVASVRESGAGEADFVLAVGGGSAIDLAKAVAALATNRHGDSVRDFLEGVGRGLKLDQPPLPILAMPTTAGTGSEATKNAVISSFDPPFKKSLRSDLLVPHTVIIDPELTLTNPPGVTAHSGMDAITQLIESFISCRSQPVTRALCVEGLRRALPHIEEAVANGQSRKAREAMAQAAFLSGVALANSGLGMAHGVAAALGVHCRVPHGLACAVMLPVALRVNRDAALSDLAELATGVLEQPGDDEATAADMFIERINAMIDNVGIPKRLSETGVRREQVPTLVRSSRGNSMNGNPREISDTELATILEAVL